MKKTFMTFMVLFIFSCGLQAQQYIYYGNHQYKSTPSWKLKLNGQFFNGDPEITIAKRPNGGYLMISIRVPDKSYYIGGTVFIFLSDGSVIKCIDRRVRDHVDNKSIALYNFTNGEIEKLKQFRITRIRFSIIGGMERSDTFTADNRRMSIGMYYYNSNVKSYYETNIAVKKLFE